MSLLLQLQEGAAAPRMPPSIYGQRACIAAVALKALGVFSSLVGPPSSMTVFWESQGYGIRLDTAETPSLAINPALHPNFSFLPFLDVNYLELYLEGTGHWVIRASDHPILSQFHCPRLFKLLHPCFQTHRYLHNIRSVQSLCLCQAHNRFVQLGFYHA